MREFLLSYSLDDDETDEGFVLGLIGGIGFGFWLLGLIVWVACLTVSEDPVSIWTTCLKELVSAWTNVVGYGFVSDLVVIEGTCCWWWC